MTCKNCRKWLAVVAILLAFLGGGSVLHPETREWIRNAVNILTGSYEMGNGGI